MTSEAEVSRALRVWGRRTRECRASICPHRGALDRRRTQDGGGLAGGSAPRPRPGGLTPGPGRAACSCRPLPCPPQLPCHTLSSGRRGAAGLAGVRPGRRRAPQWPPSPRTGPRPLCRPLATAPERTPFAAPAKKRDTDGCSARAWGPSSPSAASRAAPLAGAGFRRWASAKDTFSIFS